MIDFKQEIAKAISAFIELDSKEIKSYIEVPKDANNGDYAFPCFRLAKTLKKAPQVIAEDLGEKIDLDSNIIEKSEVAGGYLNFYINKKLLAKEVLEEIDKSAVFGDVSAVASQMRMDEKGRDRTQKTA